MWNILFIGEFIKMNLNTNKKHKKKKKNPDVSKKQYLKYGAQKIKYLTQKETTALFQAIKNNAPLRSNRKPDNLLHKRNTAVFNLAYFLALRASEVGLLRIEDFTFSNSQRAESTVWVRSLKGSIPKVCYIDKYREKILKEYLKSLGKNINQKDFMFPSPKTTKGISRWALDKMIKNYGEIAMIPKQKRHFHVLRHTMAINLAESGLDLKELQNFLRHKDLKSTMIYFSYTVAQLKNQISKVKKSQYIIGN